MGLRCRKIVRYLFLRDFYGINSSHFFHFAQFAIFQSLSNTVLRMNIEHTKWFHCAGWFVAFTSIVRALVVSFLLWPRLSSSLLNDFLGTCAATLCSIYRSCVNQWNFRNYENEEENVKWTYTLNGITF